MERVLAVTCIVGYINEAMVCFEREKEFVDIFDFYTRIPAPG